MTGSKVYADITFLINFTMDFIIIWAAARLTGVQIAYFRITLAALLGGIYAVGYLLPNLSHWYSLPFKLLFSGIMVLIGIYPRNWDEFKKSLIYFYTINFAVAGATIGITYLVKNSSESVSLSYLWLLGGVGFALFIGGYGQKLLVNRLLPHLLKYKVQLIFGQQNCSGQGFLDTGNGLRDPLTNRPVVVAEYRLVKECFPADFRLAMESSCSQEEMLDALSRSSWANRLRLIPFTSIGKSNGLLIGVRADEIKVALGKKDIHYRNMVVGIYQDRLSAEDNYQLLIPSEILNNG